MKVLMVSKACVMGIYQTKLEELARFPDIDLAVVVPPYWKEKGHRIELERSHTEGYELIVEDMALNGHFHLHFYPNLGMHVRRLQPDILHIDEEPYNLATFHATRLALAEGARPLFFTWQNLLRRYPLPFGWFERHSYRHAAHAIAGSHEGVDVLRAKGYQGAISVIPQFGVDPDTFKPGTGRESADSQTFRIGYVGRLVEEKGVDLLLEAAASLPGDWQLSILGQGPSRDHLGRLSESLRLTSKVIFRDPLPSSRMPEYYRELNVLVLPSRTRPNWKEQFGRVLIEAMASGTPVIGSSCGEIPAVVDQAGLLFAEEDVAALAAHLKLLMNDKGERDRLARLGRQRILQHYTQGRIAEDTREVYLAVMDRDGN
jgi:glycosyltransferase involved in cell wall biosynthesis